MSKKFFFQSFLSHRYKSPKTNLYFFEIFDEIAEVQFEVDEGVFSTNVSRLQKLIRDADAFIGIYPFSGSSDEANNPGELKKQSRYFRLEMDMAIRSNKPALIFYDKRYKDLLNPPAGIFSCSFDFNEVTSSGGYPSRNRHEKAFAEFCDAVLQSKAYMNSLSRIEKTKVALFVAEDQKKGSIYDDNYKNAIRAILSARNFPDLEIINGPFKLDSKFFKLLTEIDLAIVDYNEYITSCGLPAFLHGRFIPTIRMKHASIDVDPSNAHLEYFLFGGVEVGYNKDVVIWKDLDSLKEGLTQNLEIINSSVRRINTYDEAKEYFQSADKRKEAIFVSYSGKDIDIARPIINSLKTYFQTVFDYRDGESIVQGKPWLSEIFDKLSVSGIGINLYSNSYFASGNCEHEALEMVKNYDSRKMKLFPVKLYEENLTLPSFLEYIQYFRYYEYNKDPDKLVKAIIKAIGS